MRNFRLAQKNKERAFTIIELLVSISILVVLVSAFLLDFGTQNDTRNLNDATNNLVSDLHKLQSYALSSRDYSPGVPASEYDAFFPALGTGGAGPNYQLNAFDNNLTPNKMQLANVNYPVNIINSQIQLTKANNTTSNVTKAMTIRFLIPYGRIYANYSSGIFVVNEANDIVRLKLTTRDGTMCKYVTVNGITGNIGSTNTCP